MQQDSNVYYSFCLIHSQTLAHRPTHEDVILRRLFHAWQCTKCKARWYIHITVCPWLSPWHRSYWYCRMPSFRILLDPTSITDALTVRSLSAHGQEKYSLPVLNTSVGDCAVPWPWSLVSTLLLKQWRSCDRLLAGKWMLSQGESGIILTDVVTKLPNFMRPENLLQCLQQPAICPYPKPH
jgi:hypothetical protein